MYFVAFFAIKLSVQSRHLFMFQTVKSNFKLNNSVTSTKPLKCSFAELHFKFEANYYHSIF